MTPLILAIIALTNLSRSLDHLPVLVPDKTLTEVAEIRAKQLCNVPLSNKSHEGYERVFVQKRYFGWVGENLAGPDDQGGKFRDLESMQNKFMDSPSHRANILDPRYKDIGVARCGDVVVVEFGIRAKK